MNQEEWEKEVMEFMIDGGWTCDRNDETTLGFSFVEEEHRWIRDFDKKKRRFVQFDGNRKLNLKATKEE